jgi:hypothetical protein
VPLGEIVSNFLSMDSKHKHLIAKIKFWSNLLFLLPLLFAVFYKLALYIPVIAIVIIISSIYHYSNEKMLVNTDMFFALLLIFANFTLIFSGTILSPFSISAFTCALLAGYFYYRQQKHGYDLNHGLFHIFSALISIFSILAFTIH